VTSYVVSTPDKLPLRPKGSMGPVQILVGSYPRIVFQLWPFFYLPM